MLHEHLFEGIMSDLDSDTLQHKQIEGFTKGKGSYRLNAPWLVKKGAAGRAYEELNEREENKTSASDDSAREGCGCVYRC